MNGTQLDFIAGAPLNYQLGVDVPRSYANLYLKTKCPPRSWKHGPYCNAGLKGNKLYVPQGTPVSLHSIPAEIPEDSMFYLARNYSHPECCPSTYTTSTGCVCTTPEQEQFVGEQRGGNQTYYNGL